MVRDNIFIHFLKLEIFLKHPGGYYKSSRRFCHCVYEAMAVILTICLDQLVPRLAVYGMQVFKGRGALPAAAFVLGCSVV